MLFITSSVESLMVTREFVYVFAHLLLHTTTSFEAVWQKNSTGHGKTMHPASHLSLREKKQKEIFRLKAEERTLAQRFSTWGAWNAGGTRDLARWSISQNNNFYYKCGFYDRFDARLYAI